MVEEIKLQAGDRDFGKAEDPNLGSAGNIPNQKIEPKPPEVPPTDFKVAEIWVRSGQIMLDAGESFWADRCRAIGVLEFCKEIVKTAQSPKKPDLIIPGNGKAGRGIMDFVRGMGRKKK